MRDAPWMHRDERTPLQRAQDRLRHAKEVMDRASDAYDESLRNWYAAMAECDRLDAN